MFVDFFVADEPYGEANLIEGFFEMVRKDCFWVEGFGWELGSRQSKLGLASGWTGKSWVDSKRNGWMRLRYQVKVLAGSIVQAAS